MTPQELRARAAAFAVAVNRFCEPFLAKPAVRVAAEQLLRASASVASNHRAAGKARSHAEFTAKIAIVDEEADESVFWLEHLRDCRFVSGTEVEPYLVEARELSAIFTASAKTVRGRESATRAARRRSGGRHRTDDRERHR